MTYKEVNDRLTKVQTALNQLKSGKLDSTPVKTQAQLEIIKESLQKKLTTLKEQEQTMFVKTKGGDDEVVTLDKKEADKLKKDTDIVGIKTAKGKTIKEEEITVEQNHEIAKKVGKALADSLRKVGDELDTMKARNFNPTNDASYFDIYVEYKASDKTDDFKFAIKDGVLSLQGKELGAVGFLPSGEIQIHTEIIEAALIKHFESDMKEDMRSKDKEFEKSREADRLEKHPESDTIKKIQALIGKEKSLGETEDEANTSGAVGAYLTPNAFGKKKKKDKLYEDPSYIDIIGQFAALMATGYTAYQAVEKLGDGNGDISIDSIKKAIHKYSAPKNEDAEEDAKNDADYEAGWHDDPRQDEDTDVGHQDDEPSMLGASALETAEYAAKLYKKLQRYDQQDGEVDFPNWWQKKLILARDYMSAAYHYLDSEEKQPALDQLALESVVKEGRGDMERIVDLITDRAAESGFSEQEEAQEVIEAIQDYYKLGEQKEVEENVDKVLAGYPYRRHGNKVIISEPMDDAAKERIIKRCKDAGYHCAPNQAGGITITLKDGMYEGEKPLQEKLSGDQREALMDLQNVLDQAAQLGDEARQIVKDHFPRELSAGEAYDVFSFGSSSNSYDKTLESLIGDIEMAAEDDDDDYLEESRKDNDALFPDNPRLPQIKTLADKIVSIVKAEAAKGELGYIKTMEEIRYQQEHDFERTPEWNKAKGIRSDFDDYGSDTNEGVAKTKKAHDKVVTIMKDLAKKYKAGDKSVVDQLKSLTATKKKLEAMLDKDVAGIGVDQEVTEI